MGIGQVIEQALGAFQRGDGPRPSMTTLVSSEQGD